MRRPAGAFALALALTVTVAALPGGTLDTVGLRNADTSERLINPFGPVESTAVTGRGGATTDVAQASTFFAVLRWQSHPTVAGSHRPFSAWRSGYETRTPATAPSRGPPPHHRL